jgi:hypothetical protein
MDSKVRSADPSLFPTCRSKVGRGEGSGRKKRRRVALLATVLILLGLSIVSLEFALSPSSGVGYMRLDHCKKPDQLESGDDRAPTSLNPDMSEFRPCKNQTPSTIKKSRSNVERRVSKYRGMEQMALVPFTGLVVQVIHRHAGSHDIAVAPSRL